MRTIEETEQRAEKLFSLLGGKGGRVTLVLATRFEVEKGQKKGKVVRKTIGGTLVRVKGISLYAERDDRPGEWAEWYDEVRLPGSEARAIALL